MSEPPGKEPFAPDPLRPHDVPGDAPAAGVPRPKLLAGIVVVLLLAFVLAIAVWLIFF
ncbi:MAG TPA: hypothetical protein VFI37_01910 [Gaiellaceae bacterium]|nr:hypothetical protein [Gaiellaceae bacterium]